MQLILPIPAEPDMLRLIEECGKLKLHHQSPFTVRGYAYDWKQFQTWCGKFERKPLPASPETVSLYLTYRLIHDRKMVSTVNRYASAIASIHEQAGAASPIGPAVRLLLSGARRTRCECPRQMAPLTLEQIRSISIELRELGTPVAIRNRALMLIGFASALRRYNLAALNTRDIRRCPEGLIIRVNREKQDQTGKGRDIAIPRGSDLTSCPVRALDDWLDVRGCIDGPLFTRLDILAVGHHQRMSTNAVWTAVKSAAAIIGLEGVGPHSLRSGLITEAGQKGVNPLVIARTSGHRSLNTLHRYFRPADLFRANAAGLIGL